MPGASTQERSASLEALVVSLGLRIGDHRVDTLRRDNGQRDSFSV